MAETVREETLVRSLPPRKQEIVAFAMDLFAKRGFQATTVREIAEGVGLLSGSLYSHFESKVDILDNGLRPYVETSLEHNRLLGDGVEPPEEKIRLIIRQSIDGIGEWPAAAAVLHQDWEYVSSVERFSYARELRETFDDLLRGTLQDAMDTGALAPDVNTELVLQFVRAVLGSVVPRDLPDERFPGELIAEHLHRMIFGGLSTPAARAVH